MSLAERATNIEYPDSDGQPMAENPLQFQWIVTITESLRWMFVEEPNVFVAGDLLWYPVEGNNKLRIAPDALVVFGRPKGHRGSYMQWLEDGIAPQVVFEVLSPGNRVGEMTRKFAFYEKYGVEEYYLIDPDRLEADGWLRSGERLVAIEQLDDWSSPRLGIRFQVNDQGITLYQPDGRPFRTYDEVAKELKQAQREAEQAHREAEQERARAERLAERLRQLGEDV